MKKNHKYKNTPIRDGYMKKDTETNLGFFLENR